MAVVLILPVPIVVRRPRLPTAPTGSVEQKGGSVHVCTVVALIVLIAIVVVMLAMAVVLVIVGLASLSSTLTTHAVH